MVEPFSGWIAALGRASDVRHRSGTCGGDDKRKKEGQRIPRLVLLIAANHGSETFFGQKPKPKTKHIKPKRAKREKTVPSRESRIASEGKRRKIRSNDLIRFNTKQKGRQRKMLSQQAFTVYCNEVVRDAAAKKKNSGPRTSRSRLPGTSSSHFGFSRDATC